jgi:hypothetical protein
VCSDPAETIDPTDTPCEARFWSDAVVDWDALLAAVVWPRGRVLVETEAADSATLATSRPDRTTSASLVSLLPLFSRALIVNRDTRHAPAPRNRPL